MRRKAKRYRLFHVRRSFKKEFKKQIRFAIMAAIGFIIAFAWRDAIYNSSSYIVDKFIDAAEVVLSEIYTAIFITIVGVLFLLFTSKLLRDR